MQKKLYIYVIVHCMYFNQEIITNICNRIDKVHEMI